MQSLSRTTWSRKVLPMVLDTARPKYKENTTWPGMLGRYAVRKSAPMVYISQEFTIDFLEIQFIVNCNSQSDGLNKSAESGTNLRKKVTLMKSLQRKGEDAKDNETSIWLQSRCLDEKSFTPRIRRTNWRAYPSRSTKTNTTKTRSFLRGLLIQGPSWPTHMMASRGGTHLNGVGSELTFF